MAKPATQRPKLPSVGRLGLVGPQAPADLDRLGWNSEEHVELLWSLSRAPDADTALSAMVRLADALGNDWDELKATTMDSASRTLLQVSVEQAAVADTAISTLMGDDVEARKQFIQTNAKDARFIDI